MVRLKFHNQHAQSLVEVTIAIAILGLVMATAGTLATTNVRLSTESGRRTQGTTLATREMEAVYSLRDELNKDGQTLGDYFNLGGSGCKEFVMRRGESEDDYTWEASLVSGGDPVEYGHPNDFADGTAFSGHEHFRRLGRICAGNTSSDYLDRELLYDVRFRVVWKEGAPDEPERELTYRSLINAPEEAWDE